MRTWLILILSTAALQAAEPSWLDRVAPVITPAERKTYLALDPGARRKFEDDFWSNKSVTASEYFRRLVYIDSQFGSNRLGSGANTDQGRVYLSLGAPVRVTRIPSSRVFVPLEIWYYDAVPGLLDTELRLIFYQKNSIGFPKLYSPTLDTIRALLVPQAATRSLFGPNDSVTESDIRKNLTVSPAEDEVVTAAVGVATGIRTTGNDEILGQITAPAEMLSKVQRTEVRSRLIAARPKLDILQTPSPYGGLQVDLRLETSVQHELDIEVIEGAAPLYQNQLHLKFSKPEAVAYTHRLDLLPGSYRVIFTVDGAMFPYPITVSGTKSMGEILRADQSDRSSARRTPFEFDGRRIELNPQGRHALVTLERPGRITWMIRLGMQVVWRTVTEGDRIATVELPSSGFAPGSYRLEAATDTDSRIVDFAIRPNAETPKRSTVSFNANLSPASRYAFAGHQWILRGNLTEARQSLQASLAKGATDEAQIDLARVDALQGNLDAARERVRAVLAARPNSFEALSVLAYIETKLQDYPVAAELYRQALALQESPALRAALAQLPPR
jgi:GWxTD domain-containing protein